MTGLRYTRCWIIILCLVGQGVCLGEVVEEWIGKESPVIGYPIEVGRERQLFVDDAVIESKEKVSRVQHSVDKYSGNPVLRPEKSWEATSVILMSVHEKPDGTGLRMWYSGWGKHVGKPTVMCVADSADGIYWQRPVMGWVEYAGSKENNIIREGRMFRVLYDGQCSDPQQRYKAILRVKGFHRGTSPDGLHWTVHEKVLDGAYDATSVHWDPAETKWIASCKLWHNKKRVRGYAESKDFVHWSDIRYMLEADDRDDPAEQLYSLSIHRYESVYVGFLKLYNTDTDRCHIQLTFSRDGKHWQRADRTPFIPPGSKKGQWDYGNVDHPENIIYKGGELWLYYCGRETLHGEKPNRACIGLAMLRRDGFVSMEAGQEEGVLTTKPLVLKGKQLYINADAGKGQIRVEVLREGEPLLFLQTITTDSVRQRIAWDKSSSADLNAPGGQTVRLRFRMANAKLYSFWAE